MSGAPSSLHRVTVGPLVGAVSHSEARIFVRGNLPPESNEPRACFALLEWWKSSASPDSACIRVAPLNPNFDLTTVFVLRGLEASTSYSYRVAWAFGETPLDPAAFAPLMDRGAGPVHRFRTAPDDAGTPQRFAFGSCRYLLSLFGGSFFDDRGDKIFRSMQAQREAGEALDFLMMIGDQIYADDLGPLHPAFHTQEYFKRYRVAFTQPHLRQLMASLPTYMTLDDHEIEDGWPARANRKDRIRKYPAAIHAHVTYQLSHSPLFEVGERGIYGVPRKLWYTFERGCCAFFAFDVRTERVLNSEPKRMIGDAQFEALSDWLKRDEGRLKFVVSAVPFFPDFKGESDDKWSGFIEQRGEILDIIRQSRTPVVFLGGDLHFSLHARLLCESDPQLRVLSIVSSPFFWPYPHGRPSELALDQLLPTTSSARYRVQGLSPIYRTDNFTRVQVEPQGDRWSLRIEVFGRKGDCLGAHSVTL